MGITSTLKVSVGVEWVQTFHPDSCNQADLSWVRDQAEGFYNHMGSFGHGQVFNWGNDNAWETDFRHPAFGGDALNWSDNVHFCFFDSHGGNNGMRLNIDFAVAEKKCKSPSTEWKLGSKNLKWIVFAGCQAVLNSSAAHIVAVWGPPMQGVHVVCGYIGSSADAWWSNDLGEDLADDVSTRATIAGAWCDRAYSLWLNDDAIAIAAGATREDAINRRENETLDFRDTVIASTNWLAWKTRT
jgi:hypothetical protein